MANIADPQTQAIESLAIYIHWPYCARICPYCDFNVYKQKSDDDLIVSILTDLSGWRAWSGPRRITSIHFGGGTPSLMRGEDIAKIMARIQTLWGLEENCEIALEANPSDTDEDKWKDYARAGITRLSLGVQSFHGSALKLLGRDHDADSAKTACQLARKIFSSVSFDLIFGWQGQTQNLLRRDLETALSYKPDHLSCYQLTIEPDTAFARAEARGDEKAVSDDLSAEFFEQVANHLTPAGYQHYEVSNFATTNHRSQHNLTYWRGGDYVGVGPGAHGRLTKDGKRYATIAALRPKDYKDAVKKTGLGLTEKECLAPQSWGDEYVLMGLRIDEGISLARYRDITGSALADETLKPLMADGYLIQDEDTLKASPKGRFVLNKITQELLS